jgi:hypothetical protein
MNEEAELTKTPQPAQLRGKQTRAARFAASRNRCVDALATLNRYCEPHFDLALLPRTDWPDEIWETRMAKVMRAVCAALQGTETTPFVEAESPEIQVEGLVKSQQAKSEYWQWNAAELAKLTEYLEQHPGHVITPHYAHSCEVKTPEGGVYHYHRSGRLE